MRRLVILLSTLAATVVQSGAPPRAQTPNPHIETIAAKLAAALSAACPPAPYDDTRAFQTCAAALAKMRDMPFAAGILWGGEQPALRIKKKKLTHFGAPVFRTLYMPLMTYTGRWRIDRDERENVDIIRIEAFFRNALPSGEYPYPFWHSADKWNAYETMNQMSFYLDGKSKIFLITRSAGGSEASRGQYSHVQPPVFVKDQWTWTDASGQAQPRVDLFSARYRASNPHLAPVDDAYRTFALQMRNASCLSCHNPSNPDEMDHLVLLQTPAHAAGEIDAVIKAVQAGEMPLDELGLRKDIDPRLRAAILRSARAFRDALAAADKWEDARSR